MKILTVTSSIASILSVGLTIFLWQFPETVPHLIIVRDLLIVVGLFSLVFVLGVYSWISNRDKITQREQIKQLKQKLKSNFQKTTEYMNSIVRESTNTKYGHLYLARQYENVIIPKLYITSDDLKQFKKICFQATNKTKELMQIYFQTKHIDVGDDLTVTVKLIFPASHLLNFFGNVQDDEAVQIRKNDRWVITVYRDSYTYGNRQDREVVTRKFTLYSLTNNSAFNNITSNNDTYFCSNNLQLLGETYINENKNWRKQYNAALVVPIRCANGKSRMDFGFLAVDSLNSDMLDLFDPDKCLDILNHSASVLASFLLSIHLNYYSEKGDSE